MNNDGKAQAENELKLVNMKVIHSPRTPEFKSVNMKVIHSPRAPELRNI